MKTRRREGKPLKDTSAMKVWREEFEDMGKEQHNAKLKMLGLDEEDIEAFDESLEAKKKGKKASILLELEEEVGAPPGENE